MTIRVEALGDIARTHGMTGIAKAPGLSPAARRFTRLCAPRLSATFPAGPAAGCDAL
jgi:DNA-binding phage protein